MSQWINYSATPIVTRNLQIVTLWKCNIKPPEHSAQNEALCPNQKPFSCSHCDNKFMNTDPLKVQHNQHHCEATGHNERKQPFSFSHCDKKFTKRDPLKVQHYHHQSEATGQNNHSVLCCWQIQINLQIISFVWICFVISNQWYLQNQFVPEWINIIHFYLITWSLVHYAFVTFLHTINFQTKKLKKDGKKH